MNRAPLSTTLIIQAKASPYKTGLLGVLAVVLLVLVGRLLWGGPRAAEAVQPVHPIATGVASLQGPTTVFTRLSRPPLPDLPDAPARDMFKADWLTYERVSWRDSAAGEGEGESRSETAPVLQLELTLTGLADNGQHCAVINGRRVQVGDRIGELVVESIVPGLVILTGGGTGRTAIRMD